MCKSRIWEALNSRNLKKSNKTIAYLNCSIPWLIEWLSFCFDSSMTLDNHGSHWHIDHVIPVNKFDLTDPIQVEFCFSWFNLSPLKGSENMSKHDKIDIEQIQQHIKRLVHFSYIKRIFFNSFYSSLCARHLTIAGSSLELCLPL